MQDGIMRGHKREFIVCTRSGHGTQKFSESERRVKSHRYVNKTPKEVLTSEFSSSKPDAATHQDFNGQEENLEVQIPVQGTPGDWWRKSSGQEWKKEHTQMRSAFASPVNETPLCSISSHKQESRTAL